MRLSKAEFDRAIAVLRTLTGNARAKRLAELQAAEVYDVDKDGVEFVIEVEIVEKTLVTLDDDREAAPADDAVEGILKSLTPEQRKAFNQATIRRNRKVLFAGDDSAAGRRTTRGKARGFTGPDAYEKAYRWGAFALAANGHQASKSWMTERGYIRGQVEFDNSRGGALVPDVLVDDLIDLREQYGVFRREAYNVPMSSDTLIRPRRKGGLSAFFVGEAQPGTASQMQWDNVSLTAKKLMVLALMSSEISEDSIIDVGSTLANEVAYAFSQKEDFCGFFGDGSQAAGHITGIVPGLININGVDDGGGLVLASAGGQWAGISLKDFQRVMASLPSYAAIGAKWYAAPSFIWGIMQPLVMAAGGTMPIDIIEGASALKFLGYPVVATEIMPAAQDNSQVPVVLANLTQSTTLGDRRQVRIEFFSQGIIDGVDLITTDQIGVRGTERFDINNHDLGTATKAGAAIGLITRTV